MKAFILFLAGIFFFSGITIGQKTYVTRNAKISLVAIDDDDINATNNEVTSQLAPNGQITFSLLIKGLRFSSQEMQDHFNNSYIESNKFPRSDFKGTIENIKEVNFAKDGIYPVTVKGDLTMHGVKQSITSKGTITIKGGKPIAEGKFGIKLEQFNIMGGLSRPVTKGVTITVSCHYQ